MKYTNAFRNSALALLAGILFLLPGQAQELNCVVIVNSDQVSQTNQQVITTLERSLTEFINKTRWTNQVYRENERLNCPPTRRPISP